MSASRKKLFQADKFIWITALLVSIFLHGSVAAAFFRHTAENADAAEDQGVVMTIDLSPTPVARSEENLGEPAPDSPEAAASPLSPPVPEIEEKLSIESASNQPKAESTPYETPPDSLARKETEKKDDKKPDEAEATNESKPEPAAPAAAAAAPSTAGSLASRDDEFSAAQKDGSTLDLHETPASWQRALLKHLGRHKRYPQAARAKRAEGMATLEFDVSPEGRVVNARLKHSSGSPLLDQESLDMLQRAQPVPILPAEMFSRNVRIVLPVRYKLK